MMQNIKKRTVFASRDDYVLKLKINKVASFLREKVFLEASDCIFCFGWKPAQKNSQVRGENNRLHLLFMYEIQPLY